MKVRAQIAMVLNPTNASAVIPARLPARTCGPRARAWNMRGSTMSRPSPGSAIRGSGKARTDGRAAGSVARMAACIRSRAGAGASCRKYSAILTCRRSTIITSPSPSTSIICRRRHHPPRCRPRARALWSRETDGEDQLGSELGGNSRYRVRAQAQGLQFPADGRGNLRRL